MQLTQRWHRLCRLCSERQGAGAPRFEVVPGSECSVCSGTMDATDEMAERTRREVRAYEFRTFAVGITLPEGVQEREDELRSELRLKGNETVKTQAARLVASGVVRSTRKRVDKARPDLSVLADFGTGEVSVSSRPAFFYGRYSKPAGVSQRRLLCPECRGGGCQKCGGTGFDRKPSVEEALRRKIGEFTGSERMIFTWLGSEDRESRVFPPGRPFVVEVKSPKKRRIPTRFGARVKRGLVSVSSGRTLPSKPVTLPPFRFLTRIKARAAANITPEGLRELRARFRRAEVTFERPGNRPAFKKVYSVAASAKGKALVIDAELDGGLPVKRFVSGELVSPSVSEVLKTEVGCRTFDICRVKEKGGFRFTEVARNKEKDQVAP
ncbi:MAG: hypothetical protein JRN16_01905 [Nitrososphaerota archaeon]|nr:hypothetical protein [Nitrososphaerota archaeon]MDG6975453.1 hypothetical protein [Nitrososphaerota archaeon]MDG7027148.1 hypothetical protein [Nitrososphaerota archaeon]